MSDALSFLLEGGVPSAKFAVNGDFVSGIIATEPTVQQQRDYTSGKPLMWDDGTPREQLKIILDTGETDPSVEDDDGHRAVYVKGQMRSAVSAAVRKSGHKGSLVGGRLTVTYTGNGESPGRGLNPPKLYSATYEPPAAPEPAGDDSGEYPY